MRCASLTASPRIPRHYTLARQGLDTLAMIVDEAAAIRPGSVIADLKIARGLDYYTGSVYETFLDGAASLGSICSGGRYDNLASQGNRKYPGRGPVHRPELAWSATCCTGRALTASRMSARPAVLVAVWDEEDRGDSNANRQPTLRARGIAADVAPTAAKLGKQIKYADKLGIPYVWFPATAAEGARRRSARWRRGEEHRHGRAALPADCTVVGAGYCGMPSKPFRSMPTTVEKSAFRTVLSENNAMEKQRKHEPADGLSVHITPPT